MGPRPRQRLCKVVFIVVVIAFLSLVYFIKGPLDLEGGSYTSAWVVVPECLSVASVMWRTAATTQQTASTWWNAKEADWRKLSFQPVPEQNEHTHTHTHTHTCLHVTRYNIQHTLSVATALRSCISITSVTVKPAPQWSRVTDSVVFPQTSSMSE